MNCVPHHICAESCPQGSWCLLLCDCCVSWAQDAAKVLDGIGSHQFHTGDDIALHVGGQVGEERCSLMLLVEGIGQGWLREFAHLELGDCKTVSVYGVDDLACLNVTVWLDHCEGTASLRLEFISSEDVAIVNEFELSGVDIDYRTKIELTDGESSAWHPLHEDPLILKVVLLEKKMNLLA